MGTILTGLFWAGVVSLAALIVGMVMLAWPRAGRPGLYETETPQIEAGYILAVVAPPLGFAIGLVTFFKDARHGLLIMGMTVFGALLCGFYVWLILTWN